MLRSLSNHLEKFRDRNFHSSAGKMDKEVAKHEPTNEVGEYVSVRPIHRFALVWSGKFKNSKEVPNRISQTALVKSYNVCRMKACNYTIALTLIAALFYAMSGKRDAEKGLTVVQMNRKWHEEYNKKVEADQKKS